MADDDKPKKHPPSEENTDSDATDEVPAGETGNEDAVSPPGAPGDTAAREVASVMTPAPGSNEAGDEDAATPQDGDDEEAPVIPGIGLLGRLVVHYRERDVTYILDGWCAARVMAVFNGTLATWAANDILVPGLSEMRNLWATVGLDGALGLSWHPGLEAPALRTITVDPPAPASE